MALLDTLMRVLHVVFAGTWAGGTLVMAALVVPAARDGLLRADAVDWMARRFTYLTLASVVVLLLTGGHLAGTLYTFDSLASSGRGHLVLTMVGLWLVLAGLLHVSTRRLTAGLDGGVEAAARDSQAWFGVSAAVAVALLVVAGLL
ncbi:MAG: CopD family protein [Halobacteriota archaeon]